jgi:BirA family biotin operon repressor/biotin-[acetyl-CoA-carboxylase] ligase
LKFFVRDEVGSTNDEVRHLLEDTDERGPLWLRAESQTGGRGRHGRAWTSVKGNLYTSGLFPISPEPLFGAQLGFAAALSIAEAIDVYAPQAEITLKWPNDVLVGSAKISGILLETGQTDGQGWVIVGIGINLLSHPKDTPYPATHLLEHMSEADLSGPEPKFTGADAVLALLSARFEYWRETLMQEGFAQLGQAWTDRAQGLGERANIRLADRSFEARLIGLGPNGELQVQRDNGTIENIFAGDVFPHTPATES